MRNPFVYGGVVSGDAFCNRKKELEDLLKAMENGEKLFVYSERRFGKTSLVQVALNKLPKKQYITAYVDLWPTDSDLTFSIATAKAITESMSTSIKKMLATAKSFFGRLSPKLTIDEEGKPAISFEPRKSGSLNLELDEVLSAPARISAQDKKKVVVVFDEFQRILEYESDIIERRLRSIIQKQEAVSYIFLGSRKHLIQKMFLDQSRPLYRAGGHYPLKRIEEKDWLIFIKKKFNNASKRISYDQIKSICQLTEGHPFYTQHLCHVIWELCEQNNGVTKDLIDYAVQILLTRESYAYTTLWESLAINQRRFLKGLANEPSNTKYFASEFILRYGISTASNVQRAVEALLEKDIIDRENGAFVIVDRFFKIWIQKSQKALS